ncbi:hypothetical protein BT63DRAFT_185604 [Microthyrium microscopicum]|uniref:Uncharacterized protein n=1 Tax=Microthyrium microscopicum TaxID=703497 RepID=A0A6A6UKF3_9PEZI|nr:hypothetical protein BT63DRAFT_185604 [Microthyrium microscopicum]
MGIALVVVLLGNMFQYVYALPGSWSEENKDSDATESKEAAESFTRKPTLETSPRAIPDDGIVDHPDTNFYQKPGILQPLHLLIIGNLLGYSALLLTIVPKSGTSPLGSDRLDDYSHMKWLLPLMILNWFYFLVFQFVMDRMKMITPDSSGIGVLCDWYNLLQWFICFMAILSGNYLFAILEPAMVYICVACFYR